MIEQIELDTKHPFLIGASAAMDFERLGKVGDVEAAISMGWFGLKYGYRAEKKEIPFTREEFETMIDLNPEYLGVINKSAIKQIGEFTAKLGNLRPPEIS